MQARWPFTRNIANVAHARHALALDEWRRHFEAYRFALDPAALRSATCRKCGSAACTATFGDVPGRPPARRHRAALILDDAIDLGLRFDERKYLQHVTVPRGVALPAEHALGAIHTHPAVWRLIGWSRRQPPPTDVAIPQRGGAGHRDRRVTGFDLGAYARALAADERASRVGVRCATWMRRRRRWTTRGRVQPSEGRPARSTSRAHRPRGGPRRTELGCRRPRWRPATYHLRTAEAATAPLYSLAGGLAVGDAVLQVAHVPTVLKWPNDVQHLAPDGPRKLSGVLAESRPTTGGAGTDVFLGIGINVRAAALPDDLDAIATSIERAGGGVPALEVLLAALSRALGRWSAVLEESPPELVEAWKLRLATIGQRVRLATPGGPVEGDAIDVSPTGELVLRHLDGRIERYSAGDVTTLSGGTPS
ncbi:MAG: hypothetical protein U0360_00945 [Dehalococcoidia bacterium]